MHIQGPNKEKAEEALQKILKEASDYQYALVESCIVAITDQKGIIQYANDNFCKISKYNHEELIGQDHRIINSGYHSAEFIRDLWVTIANGKIWRGELKNKAKDGSVYWVDTTIVPFLDEKSKPYQYVAIRADITERKNVEYNLAKSLKDVSDYKYAIEESSIVAITDQKGIIRYANDNFCKISKYDREELIGQDHRIINSGYHSTEFIRDLWVTIAKGKIWKGELKNKARDGSVYWVDTTIVPFLDEKGKPYQYVAIRSDITGRKNAEEALRSLNETLEKKVAERTLQLELANTDLEAFSYSVSHDLKTPIRAINGFSKILEEDYHQVLDDEGKRLLSYIQENGARMSCLINDLLTFSQLGRREISRTQVDMNLVVKDVLRELGTSLNPKVSIRMDNLEPAAADASLIRQVWHNLLSNAMKYSANSDQPLIEIRSEKRDEVVYTITDNGVGFDMEYAHKLFEVFQRLHSAEDFEGTGIGLALVHRIVTKHGGRVWASSELDKGATFNFSLPAISGF